MSKKRKMYHIIYRPDNAQSEIEDVKIAAESKAQALMDLVNYTIVYNINSIERVEDD